MRGKTGEKNCGDGAMAGDYNSTKTLLGFLVERFKGVRGSFLDYAMRQGERHIEE